MCKSIIGEIILKKKLLAFGLSFALLFSVFGCGKAQTDWSAGKDAIKVNDEVLKSGYIESRVKQVFVANGIEEDSPMANSYRAGIVKSAVDLTLLLQEAQKRNLSASEADIKTLRDELVSVSGSEETFEKEMKEKGISKRDLEHLLSQQVVFNKLQEELKKEISIDSKAYYESNVEDFKVNEQVKASHILVKTEEEAKNVISELNAGKDFAEAAKLYSTDESNKNSGGSLGYFDHAQMVQPFSDAAFTMPVGTYSNIPVKTEFGYHIIKVEDKKPAHIQSYEEVKEDLENFLLTNELQTKVADLTASLNKSAKIEYLLDEYNPIKLEEKAQKELEEAQKKAEAEAKAQGNEATKKEEVPQENKQ